MRRAWPKLRRLLPLLMLAVTWPKLAKAAELGLPAKKPTEAKSSVFSFGVTGSRHNLKSGDGNEVVGNSGAVQLGTGRVGESWFGLLSLDIHMGPYEPALDDQLNVDFQGTGLTLWTGFSAQTLDLRSAAGGYGFALGLSYADIVGRSIGANHKDSRRRDGSGKPAGEDAELIDNYTMRVTNFSLLPAIFFSWLKPGRLAGNSPELLSTRGEGYVLTIGVAMPIMVSYQAKYELLDGTPQNDTGQLRGYSVLLNLTSLLGI